MPQTIPTPPAGGGGGTAAATSFNPASLPTTIVTGTDVQDAIEELDTALAGGLAGATTKSIASITVGDSPYAVAINTVVLADASGGPITVQLPAAAGVTGRVVLVNKTDGTGNAVILDGAGAETINGLPTESLTIEKSSVEVTSDGTNWHITG